MFEFIEYIYCKYPLTVCVFAAVGFIWWIATLISGTIDMIRGH